MQTRRRIALAAGVLPTGTVAGGPWMLLLATGSGLLLATAFPPYGWWPAAPVAVAGLTLACLGASARRGAGHGLAFGMVFFLTLFGWVRVIGVDAWVGLALLESLFAALLGAGLAVVCRRGGWLLWSACLWVGAELLRARLPLGGMPWGRLAFSQADTPFTPYAALGGAPLVTFAVALAGGLLAGALMAGRTGGDGSRRRPVHVGAAAMLAAAVPLVAFAIPVGNTAATSRNAPDAVTVAMVQGNVPRTVDIEAVRTEAVLGNHVAATRQLAANVRGGQVVPPDLVIWPENASDIDPLRDPAARARVSGAVEAVGVPILVGAVVAGPGPDHLRNMGIVWRPRTGPDQTYTKRHLVPFGEYVPFRDALLPYIDRLRQIPRDFYAGQRVGVLQVGPARVGDVICFEVAYDGAVRDVVAAGARAIVVQTNNATYGGTSQPEQQLAIERLRAVEHGRSVLVAATSGISAIVAPDGRVMARSREFTRDTLVAPVPLRDTRTPADLVGALPEWVIALAGLLACAVQGATTVRNFRTTARSTVRSSDRGGLEA
ncbi:MAG: apolipoprotein N-acyltransferase [Carbonactinosporaceae bacterium]